MWSPQHYFHQGQLQRVPERVLEVATEQLDHFYAENPDIPALLTLGHLAQHTQVPYWRLRAVVRRAPGSYRHFTIRKRSGGRRTISVPHPEVMLVQRWLTQHVLNKQPVHPASYAFKPGSSIVHCAARHTGARWLVKMDISGFFGSISEVSVFKVFRRLGYSRLVSFELARLTTCVTKNPYRYASRKWSNYTPYETIGHYNDSRIGHLPQGAPTSPMLSNLVMREIDAKIASAARRASLTYTRYSDDLTFSTRRNFSRSQAQTLVRTVYDLLRAVGLYANKRKTVIAPPGARMVVLGLMVDGTKPRLSRQFRDSLRQQLYYLQKFGPIEHMRKREFETVLGMKHYIRGQIDFARMVDSSFSEKMMNHFDSVDWPL